MSDLMAKNIELGAVVGRTFAGHLGRPVSDDDAQRAAHSIEHPGRLTYFSPEPERHWLIDSAVTGTAVSAALQDFTETHGRPDVVLVCLPDDKDIAGAVEATEGYERVFVDLPGSHLSFSSGPIRTQRIPVATSAGSTSTSSRTSRQGPRT